MLLYYYRCVSGVTIPGLYDGPRERLEAMFALSVTPLVDIIPVADPGALATIFRSRLEATPEQLTGLRFSLASVAEGLEAFAARQEKGGDFA